MKNKNRKEDSDGDPLLCRCEERLAKQPKNGTQATRDENTDGPASAMDIPSPSPYSRRI